MINTLREAGFKNAMIHVTGESDTGKTLFALQTGARPEETVFIDADVKGRNTVEQIRSSGMEFGMYHDLLGATEGMKELDYHAHCIDLIGQIAELPPESRRVIVWDTWEPFEKTLKPVVESDPKRFRDFYSRMGTIKGAEMWLSSFDYEAEIINRIVGMTELFVAVTHVKNHNIGGTRVPGKYVADCKKPVVQKSLMRIWVKHNPNSAVPIGLVMKRLGKTSYVEDRGIRTVNVLPRKLTPRPWPTDDSIDESLWDTIRHYWENPIGNRQPESWETPDEFELSILDGTLTEDQRHTFKLALVGEAEQEELNGLLEQDEREKALEIYEETGDYKVVASELSVTPPEAMRLVREARDS